MGRGEQKADPGLVERLALSVQTRIDGDAEFGENVGGA